jgi:hypothetical protein
MNTRAQSPISVVEDEEASARTTRSREGLAAGKPTIYGFMDVSMNQCLSRAGVGHHRG